ncbi:MAG: homocysteine S-methyltransferase family protein [Phycisphaerales bacterium]
MVRSPILLLDGAMGTVLESRSFDTRGSGWSANVVKEHPEAVEGLHDEYVRAGADVLTACTFRTTRRAIGQLWEAAAAQAVRLARAAARDGVRVAGSIAPLLDCWRPELSPGSASEPEHARLARVLADAGCDILLCETMTNVDEAIAATRAASKTGLPVWTAFSPGFRADLLNCAQVADGARRAVEAGAAAVLVNCVPVASAVHYVRAIAAAVPASTLCGCYANAGLGAHSAPDCEHYAQAALEWVRAGATIIGGCCGTTPEHIAAVGASVRKGRGGIRTHE